MGCDTLLPYYWNPERDLTLPTYYLKLQRGKRVLEVVLSASSSRQIQNDWSHCSGDHMHSQASHFMHLCNNLISESHLESFSGAGTLGLTHVLFGRCFWFPNCCSALL